MIPTNMAVATRAGALADSFCIALPSGMAVVIPNETHIRVRVAATLSEKC
ncbi:hypothetical protein EV132_11887 [Rhizobium sullae]|uniref:Uncharacterized protein n=1 Tax=Rhizobium sullae TaxID=50338 RepID=A0A4R3PWG0_RHISU|nr:hypothetical protein EV132_11887 [Rhizobium sullae]